MPVLSIFFGIIVRMWHDDHPPPHVHVEYQGYEALVDNWARAQRFETLSRIQGADHDD